MEMFSDRSHVRYLSPIVMMELAAGARTPTQKRTVDRLITPYRKAGRTILLPPDSFHSAGIILAELGWNSRGDRKYLAHDLLIALSAKAVGAVLFTANRKDFEMFSSRVHITMEFV